MPYYSEVSTTEIRTMLEDKVKGEGNVNHMYLDTEGKVTVGIGHHITSADKAALLEFFVVPGKLFRDKYGNLKPENKSPDFRDKDSSDKNDSREVTVQKATPEQIKNEFNKIKSLKKMIGDDATDFKEKTSLFMTEGAISLLFENDRREIVRELNQRLENRESEGFKKLIWYPLQAQLALINMMFGVGGKGLFGGDGKKGFPKLLCAVRVRDWENAGNESSVKKFQNERNIASRARFKSVIEIDRAKLATEAKKFEKYSSLPKEAQEAVYLMTRAAGSNSKLKEKKFSNFVYAINNGNWEDAILAIKEEKFGCDDAGGITKIIKPFIKQVSDLLLKIVAEGKSQKAFEKDLSQSTKFGIYSKLHQNVKDALLIVAKIFGDVKDIPEDFSTLIKNGKWEDAASFLKPAILKNTGAPANKALNKAKELLKKAPPKEITDFTPEQQRKIEKAIEENALMEKSLIIEGFNRGGMEEAKRVAKKFSGPRPVEVDFS